MAYCVPRGIPHSFFLGGSNKWTQDDRDKVFLWQARDQTKCPQCGTIPGDWIDEDGRPMADPPYELNSRRCVGCVDLADEQERVRKLTKGLGEDDIRGLSFYFSRKPGR